MRWSGHPFERQRRVLMTASMIGIRGKIQLEGEVVHLVAKRLFDFSGDLASLGERDSEFPVPHGRGDQVKRGAGPDPRECPMPSSREVYIPDLHIHTLKMKSRILIDRKC